MGVRRPKGQGQKPKKWDCWDVIKGHLFSKKLPKPFLFQIYFFNMDVFIPGNCILWLLLVFSSFSRAFEAPPSVPYDPKSQKCVSGFCLPLDYKRLEAPYKDSYTTVRVETDIMDVLQVSPPTNLTAIIWAQSYHQSYCSPCRLINKLCVVTIFAKFTHLLTPKWIVMVSIKKL